jgi:hypothetical protein
MNGRQKNSQGPASKRDAAAREATELQMTSLDRSRRDKVSLANGYSARDAALRYAEDSIFASEFEQALQSIYVEHLETLRRIQKRLGAASVETQDAGAEPAPPKRARGSQADLITPERVQELIGASPARGLTRGDIAARLGINSQDVRLTRVLRALKVDRLVRQSGVRRSARYHVMRTESNR